VRRRGWNIAEDKRGRSEEQDERNEKLLLFLAGGGWALGKCRRFNINSSRAGFAELTIIEGLSRRKVLSFVSSLEYASL